MIGVHPLYNPLYHFTFSLSDTLLFFRIFPSISGRGRLALLNERPPWSSISPKSRNACTYIYNALYSSTERDAAIIYAAWALATSASVFAVG